MSTLKLTISSPPQSFVEPLTVAEVEHYLGLVAMSPEDAARTALIEGFITGAREAAEWFQGEDLVQKQYDLTLDRFPAAGIALRSPLVSVDLISYKDSDGTTHALAEGTDYIVDAAKDLVLPPYGGAWPSFTPWPSSAVLVRHTAGGTQEIPKLVTVGMKMLISDWFNCRLPRDLDREEIPKGIKVLLSYGAKQRVF